MSELLLQTRALTKQYGRHRAVDQVSMHIKKGAIYGFIGRNGAGKTTTLRMISGLASPTAGEIELFGCRGRELSRIYPGELCILSASCVLSSITFDVYIDAVEDSQVLQVSSSVISLLMHDNIYVEAFANRAAAERFSDVMWAMQQILFMSFDRRLAIFLLDESASLGTDKLPLTHEQIAKLMGSAREVVTRCHSGGRGLRRPRAGVHDRRLRGHPWKDRQKLCRGHERRHSLRAGYGSPALQKAEQGYGDHV